MTLLHQQRSSFYLLSISLMLLFSCTKKAAKIENKVIISVSTDANSLNPLKARGEVSNYLSLQLFQTLLGMDYSSKKLVGILAENPPIEQLLDSNRIKFSYKIRPEATFDDGSPIDSKDIYFSFLLANCPELSFPGAADFYSFIDTVLWSNEKPKEIAFICQNNYFLNKYATGDFFVLPQKNYDPQNILAGYQLSQLRAFSDSLMPEKLKQFIENFNDQKFEKDVNFIRGSGPYKLESWQSNERIILKKKENWWGEKLSSENSFFECYPERIQYEIIADNSTALSAFKSGSVDLLKSLNPKDFKALSEEGKYKSKVVPKMGYQYLGFNLKNDLSKQLAFRKSIAFLLDKDQLISKVFYGLGKKIHSPIANFDSLRYNKTIADFKSNIDSSRYYLNLVKLNGESITVDYLYNADNEQRKLVGLILQDKAKELGISINPVGVEWSVYLERIRSGDFDLFYGSLNSSPIPPDFYNSFHSASADGGRNYFNYQSKASDSLINGIRQSSSEAERNEYYRAFQLQLKQDLPLLFLFEPLECFIYSDKIEDFASSPVRPNYWAPSIKLKTE